MPLGERIILSEEISNTLSVCLGRFINLSKVKAAFLITKGGQLLSQKGMSPKSGKLFPIVSLASGIFSSTQRLSTLLGEEGFRNFFQQGKRFSIYYSLLIEPFVFVTIFDDVAILGDVQLRAEELKEEIKKMLLSTFRRNTDSPVLTVISRTPEEALTDLFDFNM